MDTGPTNVSLIHPHLPEPTSGGSASGGGVGALRFSVLQFGHFLDRFFRSLYQKNFGFW